VIDPQHEQQGALSVDKITPIAGPSDVAAKLQQRDTEIPVVQLSQGQLIWRRFRRHRLALVGAVTLVLLTLMAALAPLISPETWLNWDYYASNLPPRLTYPGAHDWRYIMGTDSQGHSLLMWITYGARVSLAVGVISSVVTMVIAIVVGGTAGYFGGWIDAIVMRITDVFLTLPFLPLLILLSFYLSKGSMWLIIVIFGVLSWPGAARLVRGYYLTFRNQEFTEAARAVGVSDSRIIFRHILPNAMSPVIVSTTLLVAGFISAEAAIDFLGVGIRPPSVSWGLSLSNSQAYFGAGNWWWAFFPGMFLLITTLAVNFLGDGLRDALDVRTRG
jgi:ABC-type dipeptide/oligopeptide/nickel transport system permease subunit